MHRVVKRQPVNILAGIRDTGRTPARFLPVMRDRRLVRIRLARGQKVHARRRRPDSVFEDKPGLSDLDRAECCWVFGMHHFPPYFHGKQRDATAL
jgi:hypothetical protein